MVNQDLSSLQTSMLDAIEEMKSEIISLRADLNRLEGSILRERTKSVEDALTQNRLLLFANQLQDERLDDIKELTNPECQKRSQCIERFSTIAADNLKVIKALRPKEALVDFDSKIGNLCQIIEKAKGAPCEVCHQKFEKSSGEKKERCKL
jgi:hypothetical protein